MDVSKPTRPILTHWKEKWHNLSFRTELLITLALLPFVSLAASHLFGYIQQRPGWQFPDPVLRLLPAINVSIFISAGLYLLIGTAFYELLHEPRKMLFVLQAYVLLNIFRMITLYLVPLEPSPAIIPLADPIIDRFIYPNIVITKDLFFSGHVATLFLLYLAVDSRTVKNLLWIGTVVIALLVILQHVHYSIDVLAAPLFAWLSLYLVRYIHQHISISLRYQ